MPNNQCEVCFDKDKIACLLPITLPTSKIRVKRNDNSLAVRQIALKSDDLIEWQISYYNQDRELIEIGKMLEIGYKNGLLTKYDLEGLKEYAENIKSFFAGSYDIKKLTTDDKFLNEFEVLFRKVPIIHKTLANSCFVEGELKHKQRAVGYQPMLYIFIHIENVLSSIDGEPIVGRVANSKEIALWYPTLEDIKGTIKTFSVLSKIHNRDIKEILTYLL